MVPREISKELKILLKEYPVVTILGPRQAGKTTLAKALKGYGYCNLEDPGNRDFAENDPKAFLAQFKSKIILDEIQRVPGLLSHIQVQVDETKRNGHFVLTGSHQLQLRDAISQSLAGRTAILELLPFSIAELEAAKQELESFEDYIVKGFLPRVYDQKQRPHTAYSNYYRTYVERDVRQLVHLKDAALFEKFMKLLAGRVGQLVDYASLGSDVGVDAKTIKNWLSILEASFIIFKLSPYFENFGKRVIKSPKYYFIDVGLLAYILGIENVSQVSRDPLIGNIFENLIVIEALKTQLNKGSPANLYFYRDSKGNEIDLLIPSGRDLIAIEIKAGSTFSHRLSVHFEKITEPIKKINKSYIAYNGDSKKTTKIEWINFKDIKRMLS